MPIVSINFSQSQENINKIGLRSWKRFGAEYQLIDGENLETAKKILKDFVYESLKKQPEELPEEIIQTKSEPLDENGIAIAEIMLCKTIEELETYKLPATQSKAVKAAYNQKLKQLQNLSNGLEQY
jgi:hypothetical protein